MLNQFTIKKADGTTDVTFGLQGSDGTSASYIDLTASLTAPRLVKVSHQTKPIGSPGTDRHSVLAQIVVMDANNAPHVISANLTWSIPRAAEVTDVLSKDALSYLLNYVAQSGVSDALLDARIP